MRRLTVLYDATCPLCVRCKEWLGRQPALVELELLPAQSSEARRRYGQVPWLGEELVVVSDGGEVWAGAAAFIVALWALAEWREWSYRLSGTAFAPLAERFFRTISSRRRWLGGFLREPACETGTCAHRKEGRPYR
jgi:predicted DCC family thiol-disulfide oxidoreductase YuxK